MVSRLKGLHKASLSHRDGVILCAAAFARGVAGNALRRRGA